MSLDVGDGEMRSWGNWGKMCDGVFLFGFSGCPSDSDSSVSEMEFTE